VKQVAVRCQSKCLTQSTRTSARTFYTYVCVCTTQISVLVFLCMCVCLWIVLPARNSVESTNKKTQNKEELKKKQRQQQVSNIY